MRITSNREKFQKRSGSKNLQCIISPEGLDGNIASPCYINKKIVSSCGFCGSTQSGENISNCVKRMQYRREFCEYIVSKTDKGNVHLSNRLRNNLPIPSKEYPQSTVYFSVARNKGKHVVIHNVWLKQTAHQQITPKQMSNMLFEISYINKQGDIETNKRTICGEEFESMIHAMKFRTKKTFIYDATITQNETSSEDQIFTQNSIHSNASSNFNTHNFNQTLFKRQVNMNFQLGNLNFNHNDFPTEEGRYFSM